MTEYTVPKSEIIENLKRDIESKENKLEHLLDEINKVNNKISKGAAGDRFVELTNIIRITEQEIKFSKEDLENEKIDDCKYWYAPNKECTRITNLLQANGCLDFKGIMISQKRSCCGIGVGCLFKKQI